jgi:hypothetical protein
MAFDNFGVKRRVDVLGIANGQGMQAGSLLPATSVPVTQWSLRSVTQ